MRVARPGRGEYEVEAAIEGWFLKNGAMSWGYPSIVGSGPNATILHYTRSTRQMRDGDLLLPRQGDAYAITILDNNGVIWRRLGTPAALLPLGGGNVMVKGN